MLITRHPEDVFLCSNDLPINVTFDVYAFSSDDNTKLFYQWYEDDIELLNNSEFSGVNTSHLTVYNIDDTRDYGKFYCRVWFYGANPYIDYIMSDSVSILISYPVDEITEIDTIDAHIGDTVKLEATHNIYAGGKPFIININEIEWFYIDINGNYHTAGAEFYGIIEKISIYQAGMYAAKIITPCNIVEQKFQVNVTQKSNLESELLSIANDYDIELQVSPNPASDVINFIFSLPEKMTYSAEVTDLTGAAVYSVSGIANTNNTNNIIKLDIEKLNLTSGSYIFNLMFDGKKTTKSFIISR
jgi:hypothetical protein